MSAPQYLAQPEARLSEDGGTVLLCRGNWSTSFPLSQLPSQISFYRGLRDRRGGKYAAYYQPTLASLEALPIAQDAPAALTGDAPAVSPPLTASSPKRPAVHTAVHDTSQFSLGL